MGRSASHVQVALFLVCTLAGCDRLFPYEAGPADRGGDDTRPISDGRRPDSQPPWRTIAELAPSIAASTCPSPWVFVAEIAGCASKYRVCGISNPNGVTNASAVFFPSGVKYSRVRGRLRGRQWKSTDAFATSFADLGTATLDNAYVEGVSICSRNPTTQARQHIWTFAVGLIQDPGGPSCPCTGSSAVQPPPFIKDNWTCDSGNPGPGWPGVWFTQPLWGDNAWVAGCANPVPDAPWSFDVSVPPTSDPIEVRILYDDCDENVGITELKIEVR